MREIAFLELQKRRRGKAIYIYDCFTFILLLFCCMFMHAFGRLRSNEEFDVKFSTFTMVKYILNLFKVSTLFKISI